MESKHQDGSSEGHASNRTDPTADGGERTPHPGEDAFRLLIECAGDDFFLHDDKGRFLDVNQRACLSTGYTREELLGMSVTDLAPDFDQAAIEAILAGVRPGETSSATTRHRRKDGSLFPVEVRIACQLVDGRKLFLGVARDVSERVAAEDSVRRLNAELERRVAESTEQWRKTAGLLQAVMDGIPDLIYVKDAEGRYLLVNAATSRIMGRVPADILGRRDDEIFPPDLAQELVVNDRRVMSGSEPYEIEEWAFVDGVRHSYSSNKVPYRDQGGRITGLIGISRDITEMKRAAESLRRSEARWQFALDGSGDGIWDWNMRNGRVFYSRQWKAMLGYAEYEVGSAVEEWSNRVHPDDLPRCWETIGQHLRNEIPDYMLEHRMRAKDGGWRWILTRGKVIERDERGSPLRVVGTHTDITVRKEGERAVQALNQRLQLALRVSGVGIWELGADDRFVWDDQMHALYGLERGAFDGSLTQWLELLHPDDVERIAVAWQSAAAGKTVFDSEFRILLPSREVRHVRAQAHVFGAGDDAPLRALGVNRDITAERRQSDALQQSKEAAEAAERAKSEFLAVMSHEIRTPMNTVLGMTRLVLQTELAPKQRSYLGKINASAQMLIAILNDVLDFSKIEAGKLELEQTEFTLESVLESVSAVTAMKAEEKGLEIAYAVAPDVPTRLIGDSLRLGQIIINLVNNAVKFTQHGEVVVSIAATATAEPQQVRLECAVRDTGIGIAPAQLDGLFRAFAQADSHIPRQYGGTGLGLAICKQLVQLMGGEIRASSEPGRGSTFEFTVILRRSVQARTAIAPRRPPPLAGRRALIVDDNASAREILAQMVGGFGMDAVIADSGDAALATLRHAARTQRPFDLVLMDWRMPGMDGLEAARQVRYDPTLEHTPAILMVTAYGREEVLRRVEQLGLQGVLIKPVTDSTLFNTIADVLTGPHPIEPALEPTIADAAAARSPEFAPPPALGGRRVLVVDDNALNREVAGDFLAAAGIRVDTANDGEEALRRLQRADYDAVLMDVHMPGMGGLAAARAIRAHPRWDALPIIALTAQARSEDRQASIDAGMNEHLTKPIDEQVLYDTLLRVLPPRRSGDAQAPTLDVDPVLGSLDGKNERLLRLVRGFVRDFGGAPARLAEYQAAGRIDAIGLLAHTVKGSAAYLQAGELGAAAARLEEAARFGELQALDECIARFRHRLEQVLDALNALLAQPAGEPAAECGDAGGALPLIDTAEPLVRRGDYAAQALLDRIAACLAGDPAFALLEQARTQFDELDLADAGDALAHLRGTLAARGKPEASS